MQYLIKLILDYVLKVIQTKMFVKMQENNKYIFQFLGNK